MCGLFFFADGCTGCSFDMVLSSHTRAPVRLNTLLYPSGFTLVHVFLTGSAGFHSIRVSCACGRLTVYGRSAFPSALRLRNICPLGTALSPVHYIHLPQAIESVPLSFSVVKLMVVLRPARSLQCWFITAVSGLSSIFPLFASIVGFQSVGVFSRTFDHFR